MSKKKPQERLIFVDSNIFLNFYRSNTEKAVKLLERLNQLSGRAITSYQVESEVLRNRQNVMLNYKKVLTECVRGAGAPAFLADSPASKKLEKLIEATKKQAEVVRKKLYEAIANPQKDAVYKTLRAHFQADSPLNLKRDNPKRTDIKTKAQTRFSLGYPPRKGNDNSMGDAFNWEWIVSCMKSENKDVVLVTGDTDFGHFEKDTGYLNDWLAHEVQERINSRRRIHLVNLLTDGLSMLSLPVTEEEKKTEALIVQQANAAGVINIPDTGGTSIPLSSLSGFPHKSVSFFGDYVYPTFPAGMEEMLKQMKLNADAYNSMLASIPKINFSGILPALPSGANTP